MLSVSRLVHCSVERKREGSFETIGLHVSAVISRLQEVITDGDAWVALHWPGGEYDHMSYCTVTVVCGD